VVKPFLIREQLGCLCRGPSVTERKGALTMSQSVRQRHQLHPHRVPGEILFPYRTRGVLRVRFNRSGGSVGLLMHRERLPTMAPP
jgi:hypothetical protein